MQPWLMQSTGTFHTMPIESDREFLKKIDSDNQKILYSQSLEGILPDSLTGESSLKVGKEHYQVDCISIQRDKGQVYIDLAVHNFTAKTFLNNGVATFSLDDFERDCELVYFLNRLNDEPLIKILLSEA